MYAEFREELLQELKKAGAPKDIAEDVLSGYDKEFDKLFSLGKSEFEIIVSFGDPQDIAREMKDPDRLVTVEEQLLENPLLKSKNAKKNSEKRKNVAVLVLLWILATAALVFFLGLTGFMLYAAFPYIWKSFTIFETAAQQWGAFGMTAICLLICAFIIYCSVRMIKTAIKFSKNYLKGKPAVDGDDLPADKA